jgi:hypothetical protein
VSVTFVDRTLDLTGLATLDQLIPPPTMTKLTQSHKRWREPAKLGRRRDRTPVGTTFSLTLNKSATVRVAIFAMLPGRTVGKRCVVPKRSNEKDKRCSRAVLSTTLSVTRRAGADTIGFDGVIGRRKLPQGTYQAQFTAADAAGQVSPAQTLAFTIVGDPPPALSRT